MKYWWFKQIHWWSHWSELKKHFHVLGNILPQPNWNAVFPLCIPSRHNSSFELTIWSSDITDKKCLKELRNQFNKNLENQFGWKNFYTLWQLFFSNLLTADLQKVFWLTHLHNLTFPTWMKTGKKHVKMDDFDFARIDFLKVRKRSSLVHFYPPTFANIL
jgi:hypothetical protein